MAEIGKVTPRVTEKDFRMRDSDGQSAAERLQLVEALRHGNIYEVFAKQTKFKVSDFADFFSQQWKSFRGQIVQDTEIKSQEAAFHEPKLEQFALHHRGASLGSDELQFFGKAMQHFLSSGFGGKQPGEARVAKAQQGAEAGGEGAGGKLTSGAGYKAEDLGIGPEVDAAAATGETGTGTTGDGTTAGPGAREMAGATLDEWEQFQSDMWGQIFDAQFQQDYQKRMGEIKAEVQKILSMVKSGQIEPEFALIALAKVNATKNGCLMTWLGKKASHINESLNKISNDLASTSPSSPEYYAQLQNAQGQTRDGSFQLNLLVSDMQKVMQDVAGTLEFVHSFLGEVSRHRREIATKFAAH